MKKKKSIGALIWKDCKAWLFTSLSVLLVFIVASIVATQNIFLSGTISTVLGGDRQVLKAGDPSKYQYYSSDNSDFLQFAPEEEVTYGMSGKDKKKTALKMALQLNEEISEEGFVLLKNEDDALPILTTKTKNAAYTAPSSNPKISVFGKNSVNLVYGGSGSGGGDEGSNVDLYQALEDAGYNVNPQLKKFYENNSKSGSGRGSNPQMGANVYGYATGETPVSSYSGLEESYTEYSDAALVVISRIGGEGFDLPRSMVDKYGGSLVEGAEEGAHYLELDKNEKDLINMVCEEFEKVVIIVNCATSMELGFIEENDKIDAAVWVGFSGGNGINALGSLLNGTVNPSGRLVDTYAKDFTASPVYANFSDNMSVNGNAYTSAGNNTGYYYVDYEEGIYVGYRYYETMAYEEMEFGNDTWYEENVVYPFGYGTSYTSFEWTIEEKTANAVALKKDGTIEIKVSVKNTGSVAGKDVVQLYYSAPYEYGGIEKSYVTLGAYEKTPLIQPGESKTVTLTLDVEDMASYDWSDANGNGFKGYELDGGRYTIFVGSNSHQAWNDGLSIVYNVPNSGYTYAERDGATVENRFDDVSEYFIDESGNKTLFTREDFRSTFPETPTTEERDVSVDFIDSLTFVYNDAEEPYYNDTATKQGVTSENYIQLYELIQQDENGTYYVDYNDERWETILDYLTVEEMAELIGTGNFKSIQIERIGKPRTIDPDGPAGFTNFMGDPSVHDTCYYASECVIGATWNKNLAHDMGVMVGIESLVGYTNGDGRTYSGWYAPAVNIHRSPFSGRNWEYYSEDPYLSGMMGANVVAGAQSKGVYTCVKHFAVNDQETNRDTNGLITWVDEQTMREIYFKPFELIVKVGGTKAMMSSFNRLGTVWAGGSYALLTEVLREEWGFVGLVISDYNVSNAYMPPDQMIRAGGDLNLTQGYLPSTSGANVNNTHINAMRLATKNILYVVASSNAMNGLGEGVVYAYEAPLWQIGLIAFDCALVVGFAVWGVFAVRSAMKKERNRGKERS